MRVPKNDQTNLQTLEYNPGALAASFATLRGAADLANRSIADPDSCKLIRLNSLQNRLNHPIVSLAPSLSKSSSSILSAGVDLDQSSELAFPLYWRSV
jgi:hypothetical protein